MWYSDNTKHRSNDHMGTYYMTVYVLQTMIEKSNNIFQKIKIYKNINDQ
jgi:hypothetical protein